MQQPETQERVEIFVDAGNFFHLVLKKIGVSELDFSFDEFAQYLANGRKIPSLGKRYYVGTVREKVGDARSKEMMSKQTKLFTFLQSYNWELKTSKLRTRVERIIIDQRVFGYQNILKKGIKEITFERTREKGIDVKLATDLIVGALDDRYDTAIIVSSDADLIPAIDWVRKRKHKNVEYIGFSIIDKSPRKENTTPLPTMIKYTDIQRVLAEPDLRPFIKPFTQKLL